MVAASRAAAGMGYVGHPAQTFYEMINFNRGPQLHIERLFILEKWFDNLYAYLPILYEEQKKVDWFNLNIYPRLEETITNMDKLWEQYRSSFEGEHSFDPDELLFVNNMRIVMRELYVITAISKIIDKQKFTEDWDVIP